MSLLQMTRAALATRPAFAKATPVPITLDEPASQGVTDQDIPASKALAAVARYIPTEIVALYVAALAAFAHDSVGFSVVDPVVGKWIFLAFLGATPVVALLVFAGAWAKRLHAFPPLKDWNLWEMVASAIAFTAWAYALPSSPFSDIPSKDLHPRLAPFIALLTSVVLTLLGDLVVGLRRPDGQDPTAH